MSKTKLALFPLQMVLLPGERTILHIFEERYRQLIEDCEQLHIPFGIPFAIAGQLSVVGSEVDLIRVVNRYPNGSSDIEVEAKHVFRISAYYQQLDDKLYPGGEVEILTDSMNQAISADLQGAADAYFINQAGDISPEIFDGNLHIFDLGRMLQMSDQDKMRLIQARNSNQRETIVWNHLRMLEKIVAQKNSYDGRIFLN